MGKPGRYLLEFTTVGNAVKVSAIDPATGVEVSIVGSPDSGRELLSQTAVNKLRYVLNRRNGGAEGPKDGPKVDPRSRKGGILV